MRGIARALTQRSFSRTKSWPNETLHGASGFGSHSPAEFRISLMGRRTNRPRSASTQSPHGLGPVANECSAPIATFWTLKRELLKFTAAANGTLAAESAIPLD